MNYFVTVSWSSKEQPLMREYDSVTVDIENISTLSAWEILDKVKSENYELRHKDIAIVFMMPIGE